MVQKVLAKISGSAGVEVEADVARFSAWRCFPLTGLPDEIALLCRQGNELLALDEPIVLFSLGRFLDFFLDHVPALHDRVVAIVDESATLPSHRGIPVVSTSAELSHDRAVAYICETKTEIRWRLERKVPPHYTLFSPDSVRFYDDLVPSRAWIGESTSIYPIIVPDIAFRSGLDVLLLDLPSKGGVQLSVGLSYVHNALKRSSVDFQTIDVDIIMYHRYHIHRLFDLGHDPVLRNGIAFNAEPWDYPERIWIDPRQWVCLLDYFADELHEIVLKIKQAAPKVLAMSVHQRNEWCTREIARRIKAELPETLILVGGHSCYSKHFGQGAFPEHDYMVIGEADMVVGPLAEALASGGRPGNVPGVISKFDDSNQSFTPAPVPHNLDALGGNAYDLFDDFNQLYRFCDGSPTHLAIPLTRGCVWSRCSFCAERFAFRSRTPKSYVDEIERVLASGHSPYFQASDSDFGGEPEILRQVCQEIVRRGLRINFAGQIRLHKKFDLEFLQLMRAAGIAGMNFGADAFTENTIRRQKKGYTLDLLKQNHEDCLKAGILPVVNIVIGVPGETEKDIDDTIAFLSENKNIFLRVHNINICHLMENSVYWHEPEKHDIYFHGNKDELYKKYYFGIPDHLWYSVNPYIDKAVRAGRMLRLVEGLQKAGIHVTSEVLANISDVQSGGGSSSFRFYGLDDALSNPGLKIDLPKPMAIRPVYDDSLVVLTGNGGALAFAYDPKVRESLLTLGRPLWWRGELQQPNIQ